MGGTKMLHSYEQAALSRNKSLRRRATAYRPGTFNPAGATVRRTIYGRPGLRVPGGSILPHQHDALTYPNPVRASMAFAHQLQLAPHLPSRRTVYSGPIRGRTARARASAWAQARRPSAVCHEGELAGNKGQRRRSSSAAHQSGDATDSGSQLPRPGRRTWLMASLDEWQPFLEGSNQTSNLLHGSLAHSLPALVPALRRPSRQAAKQLSDQPLQPSASSLQADAERLAWVPKDAASPLEAGLGARRTGEIRMSLLGSIAEEQHGPEGEGVPPRAAEVASRPLLAAHEAKGGAGEHQDPREKSSSFLAELAAGITGRQEDQLSDEGPRSSLSGPQRAAVGPERPRPRVAFGDRLSIANSAWASATPRRTTGTDSEPADVLQSHIEDLAGLLGTGPRASAVAKAQALEDDAGPRGSATSNDQSHLDRLLRLERHLRQNNLRMTLVDRLRGQHGGEDSEDVSSEAEAKLMASYIFWNALDHPSSQHLELENLEYFLPHEQAKEALEVFDTDEDGRVSLRDIREAVVEIYNNRTNLAATLSDTRSVVNKLERLLGVLVHICFLFLYLTIWNVNLGRIWVTVSGMLLSFVFVFGGSLRNMYECIVFLFVVHPFDVGDQILVGAQTDWCTVDEISLLNTSLVRWDGHRMLYPNSKMAQDQLTNLSRSGKQGEIIKVSVDFAVSKGLLEQMQAAVQEHVEANPQDFTGECSVNVNVGGDPLKVTLSIWWCYAYNATHRGRLASARTAMVLRIGDVLAAAPDRPLYTLAPVAAAAAGLQGTAGAPGDLAAATVGLTGQQAAIDSTLSTIAA